MISSTLGGALACCGRHPPDAPPSRPSAPSRNCDGRSTRRPRRACRDTHKHAATQQCHGHRRKSVCLTMPRSPPPGAPGASSSCAHAGSTPVVLQMYAAGLLKQPLFAFYLHRSDKPQASVISPPDTEGGTMMLGGVDSRFYTGDIHYVRVVHRPAPLPLALRSIPALQPTASAVSLSTLSPSPDSSIPPSPTPSLPRRRNMTLGPRDT